MTPKAFHALFVWIGARAEMPFPVHPHMLRTEPHGYLLAERVSSRPMKARVPIQWDDDYDVPCEGAVVGRIYKAVGVMACNIGEGWARDVSQAIARELAKADDDLLPMLARQG